ncbi:MAG: hypothetical protein ACR2KV_08160, partial [Solirubrobacteraceae bacterium]
PFSIAKRILFLSRLPPRQPPCPSFLLAAAAPPIGVSGPSLTVLVLIAVGMLLVVPVVVFGLATRLARRLRGR